VFSDVKSEIFEESNEKLIVNINEWFTMIFVLLTHNVNMSELTSIQ